MTCQIPKQHQLKWCTSLGKTLKTLEIASGKCTRVSLFRSKVLLNFGQATYFAYICTITVKSVLRRPVPNQNQFIGHLLLLTSTTLAREVTLLDVLCSLVLRSGTLSEPDIPIVPQLSGERGMQAISVWPTVRHESSMGLTHVSIRLFSCQEFRRLMTQR